MKDIGIDELHYPEQFKRIWVVQVGQYSDKHIAACSTDRAAAEEIARFEREENHEIVEIEEYIDKGIRELPRWEVTFNRDGFVDYMGNGHGSGPNSVELIEGKRVKVKLYARDRETAVKAAAERRAKFLAEEAGL